MTLRLNTIMAGLLLSGTLAMSAQAADKVVIAHRGASGYLPEHSLPSKAMAYAQGADFLEQDLVMTKDDKLVVLHDHYLDRVTDVADRFPDRARKDGRYYAIDFTLDEIKSLKFTEGLTLKTASACKAIRAVSQWENLISAFTPLKKRSSLSKGLTTQRAKHRDLPRDKSAVVPPARRQRHLHQSATGAEAIRLHRQERQCLSAMFRSKRA